MRTLLLVLATASAATAFSAAPAAAEQTYPWCAQYAEAGTNCGFLTLQQCNEAVSGNGGWCDHNVFIEPNVPAGATRAQHQRMKNQAGSS